VEVWRKRAIRRKKKKKLIKIVKTDNK